MSQEDKPQEEIIHFNPNSRIVKMLGDDLIRDHTTGIMELIKNGYDADAELVKVEIKNVLDPDNLEIIIEDDGTGMTPETIKGPWAEPAAGVKEVLKKNLKRTEKGRLPLGEKGIGRFAAQKLGKDFTLITKTVESEFERVIKIDWENFEKGSKLIDVGFPLIGRKPEVFTDSKHGTKLIMRKALNPWKKSDVRKVQTSLMRLLSPSLENADFDVVLKCPEFPEFENLDRGQILENFQFKLSCEIDEKGWIEYSYYERDPEGVVKEVTSEKQNLWSIVNPDEWSKYNPSCGSFSVILYAWLLDKNELSKYGLTVDQIRILSGVSIFRDGFRILPYGDEDKDWLRLDLERINKPGKSYSNSQIIGEVNITQEDKNKNLIDKTSREGLKENDAYDHLVLLTKGIFTFLENESFGKRQELKPERKKKEKISETIEIIKKEIDDLKKKQEEKTATSKPQATEASDSHSEQSETVDVPVQKLDELKNQLEKVDASITEFIPEFEESKGKEREIFLHLIAMGLSAERLIHEFNLHVGTMSKNLANLEEKHSHNISFKALRNICEIIKNEINLIGLNRFVKKDEETPETNVRDVINSCLEAFGIQIQKYKIQIDFSHESDFVTKLSQPSLSQIIFNIIENGIFWVSRNSETDNRKMKILINEDDRTVVISNNGPNIARHMRKVIPWKTFATTRPDGHGMGLWLCNEILTKNNGSLTLLEVEHPLASHNVSFMITLQ